VYKYFLDRINPSEMIYRFHGAGRINGIRNKIVSRFYRTLHLWWSSERRSLPVEDTVCGEADWGSGEIGYGRDSS